MILTITILRQPLEYFINLPLISELTCRVGNSPRLICLAICEFTLTFFCQLVDRLIHSQSTMGTADTPLPWVSYEVQRPHGVSADTWVTLREF